jgi:hypothetical protein
LAGGNLVIKIAEFAVVDEKLHKLRLAESGGLANRVSKVPALGQGFIKLPDREPSRLAAGGNRLGRWTFCRLLALVAAASRDGSRSDPELDAGLVLGWLWRGFTPASVKAEWNAGLRLGAVRTGRTHPVRDR